MANGNAPLAVETPRIAQEIVEAPTLRYPIPIDVTPITVADVTVFTADANVDAHVESLVAANVTGSAAHVTIYVVPGGGSAALSNTVVFEQQVPANSNTVLFNRDAILLVSPGSSLVASCETDNAINLFGVRFDYLGAVG